MGEMLAHFDSQIVLTNIWADSHQTEISFNPTLRTKFKNGLT